MKPFTFLALRRIANALESIAESQRDLARIVVDDWQHRRVRPRPSKVEFGIMDVREADKLYVERQEREAVGEFDEGEAVTEPE